VENNKGSALKARAYAFLLLKYRQRSEKEISDRLKKKNFPEELIKETLAFLREKKFIDDFAFARSWIRERLARSIGPRRLKQELKLKGIPPEIIEDNLREAQQFYNESETARELAASRFSRMKSLEPGVAKRRLYAYLLRRGFSPDTVIDIINQLE
jgi:regulatory protein